MGREMMSEGFDEEMEVNGDTAARAVLEQQLRIYETVRDVISEGRDRTFARMQKQIEELEAKLEDAVGALEQVVMDCEANYPPSHRWIKHTARAAIKQIEEQKMVAKDESNHFWITEGVSN
jgi:hypothetical protein